MGFANGYVTSPLMPEMGRAVDSIPGRSLGMARHCHRRVLLTVNSSRTVIVGSANSFDGLVKLLYVNISKLGDVAVRLRWWALRGGSRVVAKAI